jgi:REP element-mobilizing transposase RayT
MAVHALEVMPDRVFVEADPMMGVAETTTRLKGQSSRVLRPESRGCRQPAG